MTDPTILLRVPTVGGDVVVNLDYVAAIEGVESGAVVAMHGGPAYHSTETAEVLLERLATADRERQARKAEQDAAPDKSTPAPDADLAPIRAVLKEIQQRARSTGGGQQSAYDDAARLLAQALRDAEALL